jgi:hypothetical protein
MKSLNVMRQFPSRLGPGDPIADRRKNSDGVMETGLVIPYIHPSARCELRDQAQNIAITDTRFFERFGIAYFRPHVMEPVRQRLAIWPGRDLQHLNELVDDAPHRGVARDGRLHRATRRVNYLDVHGLCSLAVISHPSFDSVQPHGEIIDRIRECDDSLAGLLRKLISGLAVGVLHSSELDRQVASLTPVDDDRDHDEHDHQRCDALRGQNDAGTERDRRQSIGKSGGHGHDDS